jgi:hypothetical protein
MMKTTYSTMLLVIGFMALMLMLPSAYLNAESTGSSNNSPVSLTSNINQSDIKGFNQSESPLLMANTMEEHSSSESSSNSTVETPPPVQENRSSESSSSYMRSTTETQPVVEHVVERVVEHDCIGNCSDHYKQSLVECNEPHHPKHNKCDKWARERQQECLNICSRN